MTLLLREAGKPNVGGLDVAMGDPVLLEVLDGREQVVAVPACELERQAALLAKDVREASIPGELEEQTREPTQGEHVAQRDDVLVPEVAQRLRLGEQALTTTHVVGDLEGEVPAFPPHLEHHRRAPRAQPALDPDAAREAHVPSLPRGDRRPR